MTDPKTPAGEPLSDELLEAAAGGGSENSTLIVYANTFIPFDSSF